MVAAGAAALAVLPPTRGLPEGDDLSDSTDSVSLGSMAPIEGIQASLRLLPPPLITLLR